MDYAKALIEEASGAHAVFHEFVLTLPMHPGDAIFLFFEGEDDPTFYLPHLSLNITGRDFLSFICFGRSEVLKVEELIRADGRATARCAYFVDKDHTEFTHPGAPGLSEYIFQTQHYSVENYLVCPELLNRYWVEKLHLNSTDAPTRDGLTTWSHLRGFIHRSLKG
jgi:hypothetical protein